MAKYHTTYVASDSNKLLAKQTHEGRIDIASDRPPAQLETDPADDIYAACCDANGYALHAPSMEGAARFMFFVHPDDRHHYPFRALYARYAHVKGAGAEYEATIQGGGLPLRKQHLSFSHGGKEVTMRISQIPNPPNAANDPERHISTRHYTMGLAA